MTLVVLFIFAALSGFVDFISQSDDIGIGEYDVYKALQYTLLKLPSSVFQLIPIIVLIGSLIGLGNLSKNNEITVLLSSGFSFFRLSVSTLFSGLILCFLTISFGEYLAPPMERLADQTRTKSKYNLESIGESKGFWVKEENKIIKKNKNNEKTEIKIEGINVIPKKHIPINIFSFFIIDSFSYTTLKNYQTLLHSDTLREIPRHVHITTPKDG